MSGEAVIMSLIALFVVIFYVVRRIQEMPVPPDPWDSEISPAELDTTGTRVCVKCLTPVARPGQHYCPACGNVTGEFTRYVPFVNIPFNYSIFATLWARMMNPGAALSSRLLAVFVILLAAPLMLVVGLPLLLYGKLKGKPNAEVPSGG